MSTSALLSHPSRLLIVGCGDLGTRVGQILYSEGWSIAAIRRNAQSLPETFERISLDITTIDKAHAQALPDYDALIYSITPSERSDAGYKTAYHDNVQRLIASLKEAQKLPQFWVHFSSSRVWSEDNGDWVDEHTLPLAKDHQTQHLIDGEHVLKETESLALTILRFSGIYGKSIESLQKRINHWRTSHSNQTDKWTNRIHADDAAGFTAHILRRWASGQPIESLYAVTDNRPMRQQALINWAKGIQDKSTPSNGQINNEARGKRINNQRLQESGYILKYPDYTHGYAPVC